MGIVSNRVRKQVYKKCDGRCAYCGKDMLFAQMQVDHLHPTYWNWTEEQILEAGITRGTDHIENLMPACRRCNKWKDKHDIEGLRVQILKQPAMLLADSAGFKLLLDYGLVVTAEWDGKFYYERMAGFSMSYKRITA